MSGNVWEWVWDWFVMYPDYSETDPLGASSGSYRGLRGENWSVAATDGRSAYRGYNTPSVPWSLSGFRLVRLPLSLTAK